MRGREEEWMEKERLGEGKIAEKNRGGRGEGSRLVEE